jgi:hypothetical protein
MSLEKAVVERRVFGGRQFTVVNGISRRNCALQNGTDHSMQIWVPDMRSKAE